MNVIFTTTTREITLIIPSMREITLSVPSTQGPAGPQGPQGLQGIQGETGPQGIQGDPGPKGDKGDTGDQGIQGIQGVKGDTGDQGPQGIQGIQGIPGADGVGVPVGGTAGQALVKIDGTNYSTQWSGLTGDVTGALNATVVARLQGRNVAATAPTSGQNLTWDGTAWTPTTPTASGTLAGDVTGALDSNTVVRLQNRNVAATAPATGQALVWNGTSWSPAAVSGAPGGTTGQVQFNNAGVFAGDTAFFWDNANKRLGIRTASPAATLDVSGAGSGNNAVGAFINSTLTATVNGNAYAALHVDGTFVPGAFTGTRPFISAFSGSENAAYSPYIAIVEGQSVNAPSLYFYRNIGQLLSGGTLRFAFAANGNIGQTVFDRVGDYDGFQFACGTASTLVQAFDLGTGDLLPPARRDGLTRSYYRTRGDFYTQELIVGGDTPASSDATGGTLRSGQKNFTGPNSGGSNLTIQAGRGTGNNTVGGNILFQTPNLQASGSALQTYATAVQITRTTRSLLVGSSADVARIVVQSAGATSATWTAQFHNSAGNNNALMVRDDGAVAMGTNAPDASARLDVSSTTQGFLPPRMTTAQRDLIATPAAGLVIYNASTNKHQGWNGTTWNDFY